MKSYLALFFPEIFKVLICFFKCFMLRILVKLIQVLLHLITELNRQFESLLLDFLRLAGLIGEDLW